jgi:hypothetical protein
MIVKESKENEDVEAWLLVAEMGLIVKIRDIMMV